MKYAFTLLIGLSLITAKAQEGMPALPTEMDSLSYFLGLSLGYELQTPPFEANKDLIQQGFNQAFQNEAPVDQAVAREVFQQLQVALQQAEQEAAAKEALSAEADRMTWFAENAVKDGVQTTASGLQYKILVEGDGPMPADTSMVEVHYEGSLIDGTVFDSSYERGESISFPLNRVIAGWTEGLQLMKVGSTHMLYIPPGLGYGERGAGSTIPPNAVLIFKVELLGIE